MEEENKKQKVEKILLWIVGIFAMVVFAGEISNPKYWWIQIIAGIILFCVIRISLNLGVKK